MTWLSNFLVSTVGRKQLMALTGMGLSIFLIAHLAGNLLIYQGADAFNSYAAFLGSQKWLPLARIGLAVTALVHIFLALNLTQLNSNARPTPYYYKSPSTATFASRSMILSGVLILLYVIIHLFNFTWASHEVPDGLYGVVVAKLSSPGYAFFYIASMVVLCLHLIHGIQSVFQTFGINHAKHTPLIKQACIGLSVILCLGFASIPAFLMFTKGGA